MNNYYETNSLLNETELVYTTEKDPEEESTPKTYTVDIVSKMAYLTGVSKNLYDDHPFNSSIYDELNDFIPAKIIRILCTIRTAILKNYKKVDNRMRYNLENLDTMNDLFNKDDIKYLFKNDTPLIRANYTPDKYLIDINRLITENINKCKDLFPLWVEWKYIRELFIMPKATTPSHIKNEHSKYIRSSGYYPYQVYLSWSPLDKGNLFYNGKKFIDLLYTHNNDCFNDYRKVIDKSSTIKKSIYKYLEENDDTIIVVDCENSDPYKLYGTLKSLNASEITKIKKILLVDDIHTSTTWQILEKFFSIPVEHMLIERVKENKSLVDPKVIAETCKEHYLNRINSFILCSSDSDYWALIKTLTTANFLIMIEKGKCSPSTQDALESEGIIYCSMDDFTDGNINDIKIMTLLLQMKEYIKTHMNLNVNDMMDYTFTQTRVEMSESEKRQFKDNYIKTMRLVINSDGNVSIEFKQN